MRLLRLFAVGVLLLVVLLVSSVAQVLEDSAQLGSPAEQAFEPPPEIEIESLREIERINSGKFQPYLNDTLIKSAGDLSGSTH